MLRSSLGLAGTFGAVIAVVVGCAQEAPTTVSRSHLQGPVSLVSPENGGLFKQNDASLGCDNHAARGYGFRIAFDWKDVEGAAAYKIVFWHTGSAIPAVSNVVTASEYERVLCNAFVADPNLDHWVWRVAAVDSAATDTLWSEQREYGFLPCRINDTTPCSAPPE